VAEGSLVGEAQVGATVGEGEPRADVRRQRAVRVAHQQLAAHPQVGEERFTVVEVEPQVLAAAFGTGERAACHGGGEALGTGGIAADRTRVQHRGHIYGAAHDVQAQPGADSLNLGQLRHACGLQPWGGQRR
jgi:hypothetical protein